MVAIQQFANVKTAQSLNRALHARPCRVDGPAQDLAHNG